MLACYLLLYGSRILGNLSRLKENMKNIVTIGTLLIGVLFGSVNAVQLQVSGGVLFGATGVDVGGVLYDVAFRDGTCTELFGGCESSLNFAFGTQAAALQASTALLSYVFIDGPVGSFDSEPANINGCIDEGVCITVTPYGVVNINLGSFLVLNSLTLNNSPSRGADEVNLTRFPLRSFDDLRGDGVFNYAVWARSATATPEPGVMGLLAIGLLSFAATRRRHHAI